MVVRQTVGFLLSPDGCPLIEIWKVVKNSNALQCLTVFVWWDRLLHYSLHLAVSLCLSRNILFVHEIDCWSKGWTFRCFIRSHTRRLAAGSAMRNILLFNLDSLCRGIMMLPPGLWPDYVFVRNWFVLSHFLLPYYLYHILHCRCPKSIFWLVPFFCYSESDVPTFLSNVTLDTSDTSPDVSEYLTLLMSRIRRFFWHCG